MRAPEVGPARDRVAAYHKQKIQQGYDAGGGASPSQSPSARNSRIVAALVPQGESSRSRSHGEPAPHQHKELRGGIGAGFVPRYAEIPCACRRTIGSYRLVLGIVLSREGSQLRESRTRDEHHCVRSVFFFFCLGATRFSFYTYLLPRFGFNAFPSVTDHALPYRRYHPHREDAADREGFAAAYDERFAGLDTKSSLGPGMMVMHGAAVDGGAIRSGRAQRGLHAQGEGGGGGRDFVGGGGRGAGGGDGHGGGGRGDVVVGGRHAAGEGGEETRQRRERVDGKLAGSDGNRLSERRGPHDGGGGDGQTRWSDEQGSGKPLYGETQKPTASASPRRETFAGTYGDGHTQNVGRGPCVLRKKKLSLWD